MSALLWGFKGVNFMDKLFIRAGFLSFLKICNVPCQIILNWHKGTYLRLLLYLTFSKKGQKIYIIKALILIELIYDLLTDLAQ